MSVARLDSNADWTFGLQKQGYITGTDEVAQNIKTRIKSFAFDWFLDVEAEIDWWSILSSLNNRNTILQEVERVTSNTEGVASVNDIKIISKRARDVTISIDVVTIYNDRLTLEAII
jgi:hypothetical protein